LSLVIMSESKKRKLSVKSIEEKYNAIKAVEAGRKKKMDIAKDFGVPPNTLSTWLKNNKDSIIKAFESSSFGPATKKMRTADFPDVEKALDLWFRDARSSSIPVSGPILKSRAEDLAKQLGHPDFACSSGWLSRFKARHGYQFRTICGESRAAPQKSVDDWKTGLLPTILAEYPPEDIFNCDETGLFYKMEPNKSFTLKGEDCHRGKRSKERITVLPCANMTGSEKLPLLVIGKWANPRCFKARNRPVPLEYKSQRAAWMNGDIFTEWLKKLDRKFHCQGRKVAMILDNCRAHPKVQGLKSIKLFFLPPNTTSITQPMHQGIIQNLKVQYRHKLVTRGIIPAVEKKVKFQWSILDAMDALCDAWKAVKPQTVANCFRHCGFVAPQPEDSEAPAATEDLEDPEDDFPLSVLAARLQSIGMPEPADGWMDVDQHIATSAPLTDDGIIQEVQAQAQVPEEEEEEEVPQPPTPAPTTTEVMDCLATLKELPSLP
jgi:transposase-like protein